MFNKNHKSNPDKKDLESRLKELLIERDFDAIRKIEKSIEKPTKFARDVFSLSCILDSDKKIQVLHAHNFCGHIYHYHHFIGAVFIPFLELISIGFITNKKTYLFPVCGPLNFHIEEIANHYGIKVKFYAFKLRDLIADIDGVTHVHLPSYDNAFDSDYLLKPHQIRAVREISMALCSTPPEREQPHKYKIIIVDRAAPADFYLSSESITGSSGSLRRSIPNMCDLEELLSDKYTVERVFMEQCSLKEKIEYFRNADIVIGQMGAGLNSILWMDPGTCLIEIQPLHQLKKNYNTFGNIAQTLKIYHYRILQSDLHSPVNIELVESYIDRAIIDMGASSQDEETSL